VQEWWVGAGAPFYLVTGVDSRWTEALSAMEALGLERHRVELDLVCPTAEPARRDGGARGTDVERVADDHSARELVDWVASTFPQWTVEFARAAAAGTVAVARDPGTGGVIGAAAHSVSRFGVVGPVAVDPAVQRGGVGTELMRAVLADLRVAGLRSAEISWTSTVRFYATACGARVGRSSVVLRRELGAER
jgi:GNAT superfamily N-acetyltransferase